MHDSKGWRDAFFAFGGATLGIVAGYSRLRDTATIVAAAGTVIAVIGLIGRRVRTAVQTKVSAQQFTDLRKPDEHALAFANAMGFNNGLVVGKVIEIWSHHSLDTMAPLEELGIEPSQLRFEPPIPHSFEHALRKCGGLKAYGNPNGTKFGIRKLFGGTMDDHEYPVDFFETDWNTYLSVREVTEHDAYLRSQLSHVDPEWSQLPQSTALQYIVIFKNRDVLVYLRQASVRFEPLTWAFSGEEQLHPSDFASSRIRPAEHLFRRAFVEEVLGHRGNDSEQLNLIWETDCVPLLRSVRLWTFFLEEHSGVFCPFGVYFLNINAPQLRSLREQGASSAFGTDDREGRLYTVSMAAIESLLTGGRCTATRLHGNLETAPVEEFKLHSTSRYRLWRVYAAMKRRPGSTFSSLRTK